MDKKYILFDLDGTISDPKEGMVKSIQYSLKELNIHVDNAEALTSFIGPPIRDSFQKLFGLNIEETERAVAKYREYFSETGIFENTLYDGIETMLKTLKNEGKSLILATSKAAVYAERILEYFNISQYFSFVSGSELDGRRSQKSEVIQYALDNMGITELEKAIMVGDREFDIIGANKAGIESVGVLYGYGGLQELKNAGATYIVENVPGLTSLLG